MRYLNERPEFHERRRGIACSIHAGTGGTGPQYAFFRADVAFDWMGRRARLRAVDLRERDQAVLGGAARLGPWQVQTVEIGG